MDGCQGDVRLTRQILTKDSLSKWMDKRSSADESTCISRPTQHTGVTGDNLHDNTWWMSRRHWVAVDGVIEG